MSTFLGKGKLLSDYGFFAARPGSGLPPNVIYIPEIAALSYNVADTRGTATPLIITVYRFVEGATVTIGGTLATDVTILNSTQISCTVPAHAEGVVDIVITNPDGYSSGESGEGIFEYWGPEGQNLSGFWRDFAGMPWTGQASDGYSSGRSFSTTLGTAPTVGLQNEHNIAQLTANTRLRTALPLSQYFSTNAWTFQAIANSNLINQYLFSDMGGYIMFYVGPGSEFGLPPDDWFMASYYWYSENDFTQIFTPFTPGWFVLQAVYDGSTFKLRLNGGPWASIQVTPLADFSSIMSLGAGVGFNGSIAEVNTSDTAITDVELDKYLHYAASTYDITV